MFILIKNGYRPKVTAIYVSRDEGIGALLSTVKDPGDSDPPYFETRYDAQEYKIACKLLNKNDSVRAGAYTLQRF